MSGGDSDDERRQPSPRPRAGPDAEGTPRDVHADTAESTESAASTESVADGETAGDTQGATDGSGEEEEPGRQHDPGRRAGRLRGRLPVVLAAVTVTCSLAAAATFGLLWYSQSRTDAERARLLDEAESFAAEFTTYHFTELDENFENISARLTERYEEVYGEAYESFTELLEENKADSEGEVTHVGLAEFSEDEAVVLAFVDQTTTNVNSPQPKIDRNRMVLTFTKVDGEWKVDKVDLT
ncbi:hypothetical protein H0B56_17470 [Haloechinothrix sp. YIM 98757]|uniref:Mce-associated membrane protein n=1 Tax=Haloechinothrix aidingensis TaxID=2752311 RepID=A0A838ADN6_9PSEU|nr:hypothetical protein [Haloechinothrix aidingensis]MBA0127340.1 hypothetical protein [Haloechinothrix aidingensis]